MFKQVQEVATKDIVDFVINQFKQQDAGGLFAYCRGVTIYNLAVRVYHIHRMTDPLKFADQRVFTPSEIEKEQIFIKEFVEFCKKYGKIQGYVVENDFISLN